MGVKKSVGNFFMTLAKSLQLPVAVLPVAGILVGIGRTVGSVGEAYELAVTIGNFLTNSGTAILDNMAVLFALGLALGFAKDHHGAAVLAAFVGHAVLLAGIKILNPYTSPDMEIRMGVFSGVFIGCISGAIYNRFNDVKLPTYLAFFGGKRAVPIITGIVAAALAVVFAFIWPPIQNAINAFGDWMVKSGGVGSFFFGTFNRLLIPLGLHMVLNTIFWFDLGTFTDAANVMVHGDVARYWAGDPTAGAFMTGFFPVMMFGLPAACLAMIVTAKKERRPLVVGMLGSMALTSFLTGITEPIEFSFMFLAFPLYVVHAVLTGISLAVTNMLNMHLGFTFSAGLIDYVLGFRLAQKPLMLIPIGLIYFAVYFFLFLTIIKAFNLKTPGREDDSDAAAAPAAPAGKKADASAADDEWARKLIAGLGGKENIKVLDACATRLRVEVASNAAVDEAALKAAGAKGIYNKAEGSTQVIIGGEADHIAGVMNKKLKEE